MSFLGCAATSVANSPLQLNHSRTLLLFAHGTTSTREPYHHRVKNLAWVFGCFPVSSIWMGSIYTLLWKPVQSHTSHIQRLCLTPAGANGWVGAALYVSSSTDLNRASLLHHRQTGVAGLEMYNTVMDGMLEGQEIFYERTQCAQTWLKIL